MNIIVTTTQACREPNDVLYSFLDESGLPFVPRNRKSLPVICREQGADAVIVWKAEGPVLYSGENMEEFYFHPSMAKNRLSALRKLGLPDPFLEACQIQRGDTVLDCTMGRGADSIAASYICGSGKVFGLEAALPIALVMKWGMRLYKSRMTWLDEAIHGITVEHADHNILLNKAEDRSFDVVYFDPMFRHPRHKSQPISSLRRLADHRPLEISAVKEACRVARNRVVLKETYSSGEFARLGFEKILGSRHNPINYGVIEL
ncbi:MAG: class I SAM-dependent methyltransferase [Deltaproteobacteria bacterium]